MKLKRLAEAITPKTGLPAKPLGCCYRPAQIQNFSDDFDSLGLDASVPPFLCPGLPFKYAPQYNHVLPETAHKLGRCQFVYLFQT